LFKNNDFESALFLARGVNSRHAGESRYPEVCSRRNLDPGVRRGDEMVEKFYPCPGVASRVSTLPSRVSLRPLRSLREIGFAFAVIRHLSSVICHPDIRTGGDFPSNLETEP
jgi:hypothetical protein